MSRPRRARVLTSVFLLTALTLAGCSSATAGKATSGAPPAPNSSPSTGGSTPSINPPAPNGSAPSAGPSIPTGDQLSAALLTASDLGGNFTTAGPSSGSGPGSGGTSNGGASSSGTTTSSGCPALDGLLNSAGSSFGAGNRAEADFSAGAAGPFLDEVLADSSPSDVNAGYAQLSAALTSCTSWTITSGEVSLTFNFTPITFSPGPDTTAVRLDGTYQGFELNGYIVCEKLSPVVLGYVFFQIGSGSSQVAYADFTQAVAKVEAVLGLGTATPAPA